jgi:hypothetical protein
MIETQERIDCPTCLGGTDPDYTLTPCPQCWGALKIPQVSTPLRSTLGQLYQKLLTGVTKLTDAVRMSPPGDSTASPRTERSAGVMGKEGSPDGKGDR